MNWRALRACLDGIAPARYNLVHIQTPFLPITRDWPWRAGAACRWDRHLSHVFRGLPAPLPAAVARIASSWLARSGDDQSAECSGCRGIAVGPGEAAAAGIWRAAPDPRDPHRHDRGSFAPGDGLRFRQQRESVRSNRCCSMWAGWPSRRICPSCCGCLSRCTGGNPMRCC